MIDIRFFLIKRNVDLIKNKDDVFYTKLIKLISNYIDHLCDKNVEGFPSCCV